MQRYAVIFTVVYAVATVLVAAVAEALKLPGGGGASFAVVLLASFVAAHRFNKQIGRPPEPAEKIQFARRAVVGMWLASLLMAGVFLALLTPAAEARKFLRFLGSPAFLIAFAVGAPLLSVFYYWVIRWAFGWYTKRACRPTPQRA